MESTSDEWGLAAVETGESVPWAFYPHHCLPWTTSLELVFHQSSSPPDLQQKGMEKAGFVNITVKEFYIPVGIWHKDKELAEKGLWWKVCRDGDRS